MKNRTFPEIGEPVIVREVLTEPVYDPAENTADCPYFKEPLTLVIGLIVDGDSVEYRVDARRFEPFD